jgi:alginate O-acetyltransferase complex protein AlgJ
MKKTDTLFSGLFLLFIMMPLLGFLLFEDQDLSLSEKRELSTKPSLPKSLDEIRSFTEGYEAYFNDHFGFRDTLLFLDSYFKYFVLRSSSNSRVIVGKDRWLYLEDAVSDYRNNPLLTPAEIRRLARGLQMRRNWLKTQRIDYLFVIAPNKHTIYPEHLPPHINRLGSTSRMDQLLAFLRRSTDIPVLDLRPSLQRAKSAGPVYHKIGTHWNDFGVSIAQYEIAVHLATRFPDIVPRLLIGRDFTWQDTIGGDDGLAKMIGLEGVLEQCIPTMATRLCSKRIPFNTNHYPPKTKISGCADAKRQALMFGDSFVDPLAPYLSQYFKEITFIRGRLEQDMLVHFTKKTKPDIVIDEWVERAILSEVPQSSARTGPHGLPDARAGGTLP